MSPPTWLLGFALILIGSGLHILGYAYIGGILVGIGLSINFAPWIARAKKTKSPDEYVNDGSGFEFYDTPNDWSGEMRGNVFRRNVLRRSR